jgi:putative solute:sodium symporter small subunit
MKLTERHRAYWRRNLWLTLSLLTVWAAITFVAGYYAVELNEFDFLGFPLGFYVFAQGTLIAYLAIIAVYVIAMNRLDRRYGVGERR